MVRHQGTQQIETKRLILRKFTISDVDNAYKNWVTDKEVVKYLTWPVHSSIEVTAKVIGDWISEYEKPDFYQWAIAPKEIGEVIGTISIVSSCDKHQRCEIGYCIGRQFWSKGYMTEALKAVIHFCLFDLNYNRIEAIHHPLNQASGAVMLKSGMQYEGLLRQYFLDNYEGISDKKIYSILQHEVFQKNIKQNFIKTPVYSDGVIELHCYKHIYGNRIKKHVPYYIFSITPANQNKVIGAIHLRLGFNDGIYYAGHIGYIIDEQYQNNGYATRACLLIKELAKKHGYNNILITTNPTNQASIRVCEKIGAKLIRVVNLPKDSELRNQGDTHKCIFQWMI